MAVKTQAQLKKDAAAKRKEAAKYKGRADYKDGNGRSHRQNLLDEAAVLESQATDPISFATYLRGEAQRLRKEAAKYQAGQGSYGVTQNRKLNDQAAKLEQQADKMAPPSPTDPLDEIHARQAAAGIGGPEPAAPAPPPDPVQQALDAGDVVALQKALNAAGMKGANNKPLVPDGILGRQTKAALAAYQGAHPNVAATAPAVPPARTVRGSTGGSTGTGGTVTAPAVNPPAPAAPKTMDQIRDYARANYGYLAGFLDDPELGGLILQAAREGVTDPDVLRGRLFNTQFWQHTTESQRQFDAKQKLDPATAQQAITDTANKLATQAKTLGVNVAPDRINQIARDALRNGWDDRQVRQALAHEFKYQSAQGGKSQQTGEALNVEQQLKDTAAQYLVPLSDATMGQWEQQILAGDVTADQFGAYIREQAKSMFPSLSKAIDQGVTVRQYVEPYVQTAAQLLETTPTQIDMADPKFLRGISTIDPKTGDRTAMSLADWQQYLKSLPEWRRTNNANEAASGLADQLAKTFGSVA